MLNLASHPRRSRSRVVIVDDHKAVVEMMMLVIESMPGYGIVGDAANVSDAMELCRRARPDLLILDLVLQKNSGLTLLEWTRRTFPFLRVLVFSGNIWSPTLRAALTAGVHGAVDKMASLAELRTAIEAVSEGRVYFSPSVCTQIKDMVHQRFGVRSPVVALSSREKTILRHLAEGLTVREVAALLDISTCTVANHRANLMRKIGLRSQTQLSLYAAQIGVIAEPAPADTPALT